MTEDPREEFLEPLMGMLKVGYRQFDVIPFDTIDALVSLLIQYRVREDSEFKLALGIGYYE
jgi:hypothetical protein